MGFWKRFTDALRGPDSEVRSQNERGNSFPERELRAHSQAIEATLVAYRLCESSGRPARAPGLLPRALEAEADAFLDLLDATIVELDVDAEAAKRIRLAVAVAASGAGIPFGRVTRAMQVEHWRFPRIPAALAILRLAIDLDGMGMSAVEAARVFDLFPWSQDQIRLDRDTCEGDAQRVDWLHRVAEVVKAKGGTHAAEVAVGFLCNEGPAKILWMRDPATADDHFISVFERLSAGEDIEEPSLYISDRLVVDGVLPDQVDYPLLHTHLEQLRARHQLRTTADAGRILIENFPPFQGMVLRLLKYRAESLRVIRDEPPQAREMLLAGIARRYGVD